MAKKRLRSADELLAPAVAETVDKLASDDVDVGAVQLAKRYAALIDAAHEAVLDAEKAWDELPADDFNGRRHLAMLEKRVEAQNVLAELGPRLLAVLTELGATPGGRSKIHKGVKQDGRPSGLARLRDARTSA